MDYLVKECDYRCPMYNSEYHACQHPTRLQKIEEYSADKIVCPLRKEPLILIALFD